MKVLLIGGSRFVGPMVVERLLAHGHSVTMFNRGTHPEQNLAGVMTIKGDRNEGFSISEHFDVVIDMCAYTGKQTKAALEQLQFDFFIHFGTSAAYKKTEIFPLTEASEIGLWEFMGDYGKGKVECEKVLKNSGKKYATIRPTYILGPNNYMDRENFIYSHIETGQSLVLPGNGQALVQYVFAKDVADIMVLLTEKQVVGAFNCASDEAITILGIVEEMAKIVGKKAVIKYNPAADGSNHNEVEFPFANENMILSTQPIKDLGFDFTPLLKGLHEDFDSYYSTLLK